MLSSNMNSLKVTKFTFYVRQFCNRTQKVEKYAQAKTTDGNMREKYTSIDKTEM